ncbi:multidomain chromatinic protein [Cryptosporidium canis]|uniref:[histone H3]-lysine(4) N-trimethyltransferase n=1 Tax=Cryptosporidium canis TaxID=195482 RepID=A0A9D5DP02_9CRYT|nr:multidomain chromatinic protein [Cryptosporidium canis]
MTLDTLNSSKRKGGYANSEDGEVTGGGKKIKSLNQKLSTDLSHNCTKIFQSRSKRGESSMDIFVQANDHDETDLVKLNAIEIKSLKDGFRYLGYRCRVVVSRQRLKEPKNNFPNSFNWVEGIIKYWDPKFKLFFVHFLLSPSAHSFNNSSGISKHEWKYLATQNNSPSANTQLSNLILSPFAIDRGWFDSNPITIRVYGDSPILELSYIPNKGCLERFKCKESTNESCTKCKIQFMSEENFRSCEICSRKFHIRCTTEGNWSVQELKDSDTINLFRFHYPSNLELLLIANEHNKYIRERRKVWKRSDINSCIDSNLTSNKISHESQLPYDLVDVEELERALPAEVKAIILENYNLSHTNIRKLLSKLPNKAGSIIGDHQVKILCRNYRYNKRNRSTMLTHSLKDDEEYSSIITSVESSPCKTFYEDDKYAQNYSSGSELNSKLVLIKSEHILEHQTVEINELGSSDGVRSENTPIQVIVDTNMNDKIQNEYHYRCKDCISCIYCNESLLRIPLILRPSELPSRSIVYSQFPTKLENFVVCTACGICYHGSCGNSFVPPLIFGGNNFKCSNCCKCIHCGYKDDGFMDYTSWDSTFTSCIRCCKGFEKGQFCSICRKIWTSSWEGEWLQCDICRFWVHYDCDKDLNKPIEFYSNMSNYYNCPVCRSNDNCLKYKRILDHFMCLDKSKDFVSIPLPSYQNYWKVVKIPMDIITITKNLESKKYESDKFSFIRDIFRIIYNAQISHMPNHRIFKLAANILKKITNLFKLLFGEDTLIDFFRTIKNDDSMSILMDQLDINSSVRNKGNNELVESNDLNRNTDQSKAPGSLVTETNMDNDLIALTEYYLSQIDMGLGLSNRLRKTTSIRPLFSSDGVTLINSIFEDLVFEFQKCAICKHKSNLIYCNYCGSGIHYECSQEANHPYICNLCTVCHICSDIFTEIDSPIISCIKCKKKAHYTCIWQESDSHLFKKKNELRRANDFSGLLKDNRDYICKWRILSSNSSSNKPKVLINSPFTAVLGKGYYQHLINEIYLCMECFNNKEYLYSNLFMKKYVQEHNFLFQKVIRLQNILSEIISEQTEGSCLDKIQEKYLFKILNRISKVNLKQLDTSRLKENMVICNVCSDSFYCRDFDDLMDIAYDTSVCSISLNFICDICTTLKHDIKNKSNIFTEHFSNNDSSSIQNSKFKTMVDFPSILNTLISTSQFRLTLTRDINLIMRIFLNPLLDQVIDGIQGKNISNPDINLEKVKDEIFFSYTNSEFVRKEHQKILNSFLLWHLFYIHQGDSFDFSNLRKSYLQYFYKKNTNLNNLIQSDTLSIIIGSIENMVLSNEINIAESMHRSIQYLLSDPEYLSFLNFYSTLLFLPGNAYLRSLVNMNTINIQAIMDAKLFFDMNNSFENYISKSNDIAKNLTSIPKQKSLKNEIIQGLSLIKSQIEKDCSRNFSLDISIFVLIYKLTLAYLSKSDRTDANLIKCKFCGKSKNILLGEQLLSLENNIYLHKECIIWSLPFVLEPVLNNIDMGYESKFDGIKKKSEIYSPKYPTFGHISWPIIRRPIRVDINDIIITLNDMNALKCSLCENLGATIKCSGNDSCFKYYHIDCIFMNLNLGSNLLYSQDDSSKEEMKDNIVIKKDSILISSVHIRIKYRRVWCSECWEMYKLLIEPESSFSEGLTGGVLFTFVRMLSVDINIVRDMEFKYELMDIHNRPLDLFLEKLITIFNNFNKKSCSKVKALIQNLKRVRNSVSNNMIFDPCIVNESLVFLDSGIIFGDKNLKSQEKMAILPINYKTLRVWKSSKILNKLFNIKSYHALYLCSIVAFNGEKVFQVDWIPSSLYELNKVNELLSTRENLKKDELLIDVCINGIDHKLFGIPLIRDFNLKNLFSSFVGFLYADSLDNLDNDTLECLLYRNYLPDHSLLCFNGQNGHFGTECNIKPEVFFGFREEFINDQITCKFDKFCLSELITELNSKKIFPEIVHPELWTTHRQYSFTDKLLNFEGLGFAYCDLGKTEIIGKRINEDLFNIVHTEFSIDLDNSELMTNIQSLQEPSRRNRAKLEDMVPSKLYRYLDSLPYDKRLAIRKSSIHGFGLFAREPIRAGEPIIEYVGELIRNSVADKRENAYKSYGNRDGSCYMFRLDELNVLDATNIGNHARFMNHCCDPNSICKVISVDSHKHIVIFSKKDINKDEEITYDYQFNVEEASEKITCHCGASNCLGRMN